MTHRPFIHRLSLTTALGATLLTHPLALGMDIDNAPNPVAPSTSTPVGTSSVPTAPRSDRDKNDFRLAAGANAFAKVQDYLTQGMPVDAVPAHSGDGDTALMRASAAGHKNIVALLLDRGAQIDLQNKNGETALVWAVSRGYKDVVALLLDKGAKTDIQDKDGYTALMQAIHQVRKDMQAIHQVRKDIVALLLDKGARTDLQNKHGRTALMTASTFGHEKIVTLLLDKGAEVDLQDKDGYTALVWAVSRDYKDVVALLLDKGANRDLKNKDGKTPLDIAKINGYNEIVALLDVPNPEQKIWEARVKIITDGGFLKDPTKAGMSAADLAEFKDAVTCPITQEIMRDPVRTPTGKHAYERSAITEWVMVHKTDPLDRSEQTIDKYQPDTKLAQKIKAFMDKHAPVSEKQ